MEDFSQIYTLSIEYEYVCNLRWLLDVTYNQALLGEVLRARSTLPSFHPIVKDEEVKTGRGDD